MSRRSDNDGCQTRHFLALSPFARSIAQPAVWLLIESLVGVPEFDRFQVHPSCFLIFLRPTRARQHHEMHDISEPGTHLALIRPGDVIVCVATSPVWSILFPSIGALVTDAGGLLSHQAIIAREYRIPAVVATGNATELLRDGQRVRVDGDRGLVTVLKLVR